MRRKQIWGICGIIGFFAVIFLVSAIFVKNLNYIVNDPVGVRNLIQRYGFRAYFLYFLFYIFQIFFAPVPGQVLNIASGMLFGPLKGFFVSWFAVITGGFLAMLIARFFGKKMLRLFFEEKTTKLEREITRRGLLLIIFLALLPNPIGDGLFYLAGLTNIPLKILTVLIAICRIPGILVYVFAGDKIMSSGVKGWVIGGIGLVIAIILYFIFQKRIEMTFEKYIKKVDIQV